MQEQEHHLIFAQLQEVQSQQIAFQLSLQHIQQNQNDQYQNIAQILNLLKFDQPFDQFTSKQPPQKSLNVPNLAPHLQQMHNHLSNSRSVIDQTSKNLNLKIEQIQPLINQFEQVLQTDIHYLRELRDSDILNQLSNIELIHFRIDQMGESINKANQNMIGLRSIINEKTTQKDCQDLYQRIRSEFASEESINALKRQIQVWTKQVEMQCAKNEEIVNIRKYIEQFEEQFSNKIEDLIKVSYNGKEEILKKILVDNDQLNAVHEKLIKNIASEKRDVMNHLDHRISNLMTKINPEEIERKINFVNSQLFQKIETSNQNLSQIIDNFKVQSKLDFTGIKQTQDLHLQIQIQMNTFASEFNKISYRIDNMVKVDTFCEFTQKLGRLDEELRISNKQFENYKTEQGFLHQVEQHKSNMQQLELDKIKSDIDNMGIDIGFVRKLIDQKLGDKNTSSENHTIERDDIQPTVKVQLKSLSQSEQIKKDKIVTAVNVEEIKSQMSNLDEHLKKELSQIHQQIIRIHKTICDVINLSEYQSDQKDQLAKMLDDDNISLTNVTRLNTCADDSVPNLKFRKNIRINTSSNFNDSKIRQHTQPKAETPQTEKKSVKKLRDFVKNKKFAQLNNT